MQHGSWRWAFFINIPLALAVLGLTLWRVPESRAEKIARHVTELECCSNVVPMNWVGSSTLLPAVAAIDAGLRSFNRTMPEEVNRILTDHVSDLLFVTEEGGIQNLKLEGMPDEKIHFVGTP